VVNSTFKKVKASLLVVAIDAILGIAQEFVDFSLQMAYLEFLLLVV
jgi:hypothetical protein